jgi:putative Holliday junction resolvase
MHVMKLLALDFGLKKIGVAITDDSQQFAFAKDMLVNNEKLFISLNQLIIAEKVGMIIMGRSPSDEIRKASKIIAKKIEKYCNIPVLFVDEAYSTKQALDLPHTLGLKKKHRQQFDDDSAAAAYILEGYLQSRLT